jgi:ABC-type phosphate transport system auxiliary subunit
MPWGDVAKAALEKAIEVYEGLAKLAATVGQIDSRLIDFRDETRKRQTDLEHRLENRSNSIEARVDRKSDDSEARIDRKISDLDERLRKLESRMAQLEGKASAALAEAYKAVLLREFESHQKPAGTDPRAPNGSSLINNG